MKDNHLVWWPSISPVLSPHYQLLRMRHSGDSGRIVSCKEGWAQGRRKNPVVVYFSVLLKQSFYASRRSLWWRAAVTAWISDHSQPIRGQYHGHVIHLSQSEASIRVTWSLLANQRQVSRSHDHSRPIRGWGSPILSCAKYSYLSDEGEKLNTFNLI